MPIYEYKCNNCGHEFELIQKMSDNPVTECEQCHKDSAERLVSAAGFQLKGTGWYETDFKNKVKPAAKDVKQSASSKTTSKDSE